MHARSLCNLPGQISFVKENFEKDFETSCAETVDQGLDEGLVQITLLVRVTDLKNNTHKVRVLAIYFFNHSMFVLPLIFILTI